MERLIFQKYETAGTSTTKPMDVKGINQTRVSTLSRTAVSRLADSVDIIQEKDLGASRSAISRPADSMDVN